MGGRVLRGMGYGIRKWLGWVDRHNSAHVFLPPAFGKKVAARTEEKYKS